MGERYRKVELYNTKRPFMPMMGETSPLFAAKYPEIANGFDNLHMLHDMVNDVLASDWMTEAQKQEQIKRAVYMTSADAHRECKAGENKGVIDGISHDHRFMEGMPGMGLMKTGEATHGAAHSPAHGMDHGAMKEQSATKEKFDPTELMWMDKMGWMNMAQCHPARCRFPAWEGSRPAMASLHN